jgi:hypothetical protein
VVNASLNWASIVGIVLAVGGAFLYFMRSFKPALARDYDVFFAAIGLLCGGILFFQGWRLDPILQFGQFLLAGTTVFFAYESVRLRGVTTEQARRSSYFDEEEPGPFRPRGGLGGGRDWADDRERFDEPEPIRRRIPSRGDEPSDEDFYRPRRASRAAIPERAASRDEGSRSEARGADWQRPRNQGFDDFGAEAAAPDYDNPRADRSRYSAGGARAATGDFGARRRERESGEVRRGSRPVPASDAMPRSSRRPAAGAEASDSGTTAAAMGARGLAGVPQGSPIRGGTTAAPVSDADFTPIDSRSNRPAPVAPPPGPGRATPDKASDASSGRRDNSGRFDD